MGEIIYPEEHPSLTIGRQLRQIEQDAKDLHIGAMIDEENEKDCENCPQFSYCDLVHCI